MGHIGFPAQPAHIRMAPHDARCGTGRVQQDGIERLPIPPCCRMGRIGGQYGSLQAEPRQVVVNTLASHGIDVQCGDCCVREFEQVPGFSTRGGTGVEYAQRSLPGQPLQQQGSRHLRCTILHRYRASFKAGQSLHRYRVVQCDGRRSICLCRQSGLLQAREIVVPACLPHIGAQGHGCLGIGCLQQLLPMLRMVLLDTLNPPLRVVPLGHGIRAGQRDQAVAFAQKTAQARIDKVSLRAGGRVAFGCLYSLVDQGEGVVGCALI